MNNLSIGRMPPDGGTAPLVNRARKRSRPSGRVSTFAAFMKSEGIRKIERYEALDKFSVVLRDGRLGIAPTLEEALANARQPDAERLA